MEFKEFNELLSQYDINSALKIKKAYDFACHYHDGQLRQSGEEYITHPVNVAIILMKYHADCDTVCAGLLHDVLEDTQACEEDILENFDSVVLSLVKGVTNLVTPELSKRELQIANIRRVITSITEDVRIIIIKLADRLHNMRTLEYKNPERQKKKAIETLEIYAPLANCIGAYNIKRELEDLSFMYLKTSEFNRIFDYCEKIKVDYSKTIDEMVSQIKERLNKMHINNSISMKMRNIYGIYKNLQQGKTYEKMHDLVAIETLVKSYASCYQTLGVIHQSYPCLEAGFKDYISTPKTNMYQGLHTTVFGPNQHLIQNQIRTYEMDKIAQYGLLSYWQKDSSNAHLKMQSDLNKKFQFYKSLIQINSEFSDNQEFVAQVQFELLDKKIYVYTADGVVIELPLGSTVIDAAYHISDEVGDHMSKAIVNDEVVSFNYMLKNKDRLLIKTNPNVSNHYGWENIAHTSYAKTRIKELNSSNH